MNINVVVENGDFVVVDKPVSLSVQDESSAQGILPLLRQQLNIDKLWLVHRLDKVTSGLLLLAKNQPSASELSRLFATRQVEKFYLAVTGKKPAKKQGMVVGDMKKIRAGQWALSKSTENPAISQFDSVGLGDGNRLLLIKPFTGKTHQIRVMCKSLGSPILGDTLYKGTEADRTYLHAFAMRFNFKGTDFDIQHLPSFGEYFCNDNFTEKVQNLASPWRLNWPKIPSSLVSKTQNSQQ